MRKHLLLTMLAALFVAIFSGYVCARDTQSITAKAEVAELNPRFSIKIYKSKGTDYDWEHPLPPSAGMDFGTLVNADPNDPTSALAAQHHFMVLVGVITNTGKPYAIRYTGAPLRKNGSHPRIKLARDAWTVSADRHYKPDTKYPAGITTGIHSAEDTYVVYNSNSKGESDTIRLYFGITGDPRQSPAGDNAQLIPPTQEPGKYWGTVKLDVYKK